MPEQGTHHVGFLAAVSWLGKKSSRYISVAQTTENETPSLKIKKFGESDGKPATEKALRYIHVTRTCQNAHPFENFTFCKRLVRRIYSPGNIFRSLDYTRLYEQQRAGQRNSASGPQTSLNRYKRRFRQGVHDRKPPKDTVCDTPSIQRDRLTWIATWLSNRKADASRWRSRWITSSSFNTKLNWCFAFLLIIINKNANVNSFRKKVNFFFTIFSCYGTIKIRNGKDGLAQ